MNPIEKTLEYHELLMIYSNTSKFDDDTLPNGFHYEFYKSGDEEEWAKIHVESGEFMSIDEGIKIFHRFYDSFLEELQKRMFFVVTSTGEKVGTVTISLLSKKEFGYEAVVDWFAIKKQYQGYKLSLPMINKFIKLANELGHKELLLHTQTHTWLAAKLYLDAGFEPFNVEEDIKGWQILKTITNHSKLKNIKKIPENNMYFEMALKIKSKLNELFKDNYEYSIWYKNGRNDIEVNYKNILYKYKYFYKNNEILLEDHNQN